jgi:ribonuclease Z
MDCVLLGTGGMMPTPERLLTSLAVRLEGKLYVFDAGEGAQIGLKRSHLGVRGLDTIAVTHLHADHVLGLPGILMLRAQMENPEPLTVLGPPGLEEFLRQMQQNLGYYLGYPLRVVEWSESGPREAYRDQRVRIFWEPLKHTRFCLGYRMEELERPGRFIKGKALALGVPEGPLWGQLQKGREVKLESGGTVTPGQVLGPARRGRHLAFVVDTRPCKPLYRLCEGVDLAVMEGMFMPEHADQAEAKGHLTVREAARIARRAGAARAVLVHLSPRYGNDQLEDLDAVAAEEFSQARVGRELEVHTVTLTEVDARDGEKG